MNDPREVLGPVLTEAIEELIERKIERAHTASGSAPEWMSVKDAAAYVSVSPRALTRRLDWGQIESSYFGTRRLVSRRSLLAYVESGREGR